MFFHAYQIQYSDGGDCDENLCYVALCSLLEI